MILEEVETLVSNISYKEGWSVIAVPDRLARRIYIQLYVTNGVDSVTGKPTEWKSGKRFLSNFMTAQEVVGQVFDLIKAAEMHEVHEWFRYKGASIYNPHLSPDALVEVARKKENFLIREDSMTNA